METTYIEIPCANADIVNSLFHRITSIPSLILITVFVYFIIVTIKLTYRKGLSFLVEDGGVIVHLPTFLFSIYLVILFKITVLPGVSWFPISGTRLENTLVIWFGVGLSTVNFIPLKSIMAVFDHGILYGLYNNLGNLLMLSPFGFFLPMVFKKFNARRTMILGVFVTLFIEFLQFFEMRSVDIDDIFLNIIGVLIGCFLFFILKKPFLESQFSSSHIQR